MAAAELARVRQLYGAATAFFQAVGAKAPDYAFIATFRQLASGLEDARDSSECRPGIPGGINRWQQFKIRQRCVEWQRLYEQSPQSFHEMLMSLRPSEFETSIWSRELYKLQNRLQEPRPTDEKRLQQPVHEARESVSNLDPQGSLLQLDPHGQPDLLADFQFGPQNVRLGTDPQEVRLRTDAHGQPDLLSDF